MSLRISVALCTYNGSSYLQEQLRSFQEQSRRPDEVIAVDDGSTDSTVEIIRAFAERAPFPVRVCVNPKTVGVAKNFEAAIRKCNGDILALADQDDFWLAGKLERIEEEFVARPATGCVFTDAEITDQQLQSLGYSLWAVTGIYTREYASFRRGDPLSVLLRRNVATGATMAFRSHLIEFVLPIPEGWIHDEWIAVMSAAVSEIVAIREPLIKYRQHSKNQIGAVKKMLPQTVDKSLSRDLHVDLARSRALLARLAGLNLERVVGESGWLIKRRVQEKISHVEARIELRERFATGVGKACNELIQGRYGKYSNGFRSFLSDVWS